MIDNGHIPVAPTPQIGSLLVACCRTILAYMHCRKGTLMCQCNRLRCPLARLSGLQCFNMGHNGHGVNMYGVIMSLMGGEIYMQAEI